MIVTQSFTSAGNNFHQKVFGLFPFFEFGVCYGKVPHTRQSVWVGAAQLAFELLRDELWVGS